jgi:hypothetical protein
MFYCSLSHYLNITVEELIVDTTAKHYSVRALYITNIMLPLTLTPPINAYCCHNLLPSILQGYYTPTQGLQADKRL